MDFLRGQSEELAEAQIGERQAQQAGVILRWRACCIRATLLRHSTRLLARHTPRSTSATIRDGSGQSEPALLSGTTRANALARVAAESRQG